MPYKHKFRHAESMRRLRAKRAAIEIPKAKHVVLRKKCKRDLLLFIRSFLVAPGSFDLPFSPAHIEVVRTLQQTILSGGQFALAMPRGTGKSSLLVAALLWAILYGHRRFLLAIRATTADAREIIRDLVAWLETEGTKLAEAFPEACVPFAALGGSPRKAASQNVGGVRTQMSISMNQLVFPTIKGSPSSGAILLARGIESSIRGLNRNQRRPDLVLIDDVESSESAYCSSSIERIQRVLDRDIAGLPGPGKSVAAFFLSTIQRKGGIADQYTDPAKKPAWNGKRYAALIAPPERQDLWSEYEVKRKANPDDANAFYAERRKEMDKGAVVLWEHRFDPEKETSALQAIFNYRCDYGEGSFLTELQNQPPEEMELVDDKLSTKDVTKKTVAIPLGIVPANATKVVVGVDVGKHLLHYVVAAFDRHNGGHVLDYGTRDVPAFSDVGYSVKKALTIFRDENLARGWPDEAGNTRSADLVLVDSGYQPDAVYAFCRENGFRKHKPTKGHSCTGMEKNGVRLSRYFVPKDTGGGVIVGNNWYISKVNASSILCHLNVDHFKESLLDRWKMEAGQPGGLTLYDAPWTDHIRFASHQTAESLADDFRPGKGLSRRWVKHSRANHWLDCLVLCLCGSAVMGVPEPVADDDAPPVG